MITSKRRTLIVGTAIALALFATACGDESSDSGGTTATSAAASTSSTASSAAGSTTAAPATTATTKADDNAPQTAAQLNASGATFPKAFYEEVIASFQEAGGKITVNYGGGGSGKVNGNWGDLVHRGGWQRPEREMANDAVCPVCTAR